MYSIQSNSEQPLESCLEELRRKFEQELGTNDDDTPEEATTAPNYCSRFAFSEPLYQHYTPRVQRQRTVGEADLVNSAARQRLLAASRLGSQRTLWCELPEV